MQSGRVAWHSLEHSIPWTYHVAHPVHLGTQTGKRAIRTAVHELEVGSCELGGGGMEKDQSTMIIVEEENCSIRLACHSGLKGFIR